MDFHVCLCVSLIIFTTGHTQGDYKPPVYEIDLDLPPNERWVAVGKDYSHYFPMILNFTRTYVPTILMPILWDLATKMDDYMPKDMADEMRGIASASAVPVGEVVLLNIMYELFSYNESTPILGCTSIIAQDENNNIIHGRNMDYLFGDLLRDMTIMIKFKKNGEHLYSMATFAYYIGVLTGQREGAYTVSVNQRGTGTFLENIAMVIMTRFKNFLGFELRHVLENEIHYNSAVRRLSMVPLAAPVYIIVGGINPGEGVVLTRGRIGLADRWSLNVTKGQWYVLETNWDHWKDNDRRKIVGVKAMNTTGRQHITAETMYGVLSLKPVRNDNTVFTSIMSAAHSDLFYNMTLVRTIPFQSQKLTKYPVYRQF